MLDIPTAAVLDKYGLIGGCTRLRVPIDVARLREELDALPPGAWRGTAGRVGVHSPADAIFLRGFAPAEGEKPIEDREALDALPYIRSVIEMALPAPRLRCLLAKLPAGAGIAPHIDRAPYFAKSIRIHIPIVSNPQVAMMAGGLCYRMIPGEVWALNNSGPHAVWNAHASDARTHLICDYLPNEWLLEVLAHGERGLGVRRDEVSRHLATLLGARAG
jgi:Aspartyl/Asparaginyl beta-hydroxylase